MTASDERRSHRAAPMAPDERRRAIVEAVVPLLLEEGDVTTRRIAEAAGIAEGTIFRVFPDKPALLMAAAEETMNPSDGRARLEASLEGLTSLRDKLLVTVQSLLARSERVMAVMFALRKLWTTEGRGRPGGDGPPKFMIEANHALHEMLTDVFEPHRDELTVEPEAAAQLLRTLVLGSRHPGGHDEIQLTPDQIVDALLDGIRTHRETKS